VECKTAADCQAGWSCVQDPAVDIARPACPPNEPCDPIPTPAPGPTTSHCLPPYYGANSSGGLEVPGAPGSTTTVGTVGPSNPGNPGGAGTSSTGSGGTSSNNGTAGSGSGESRDVAACSFGHAPASTGALSLLAMLGALVGLSRRRARR
jgi:hypothetical protein